MSASPRINKQYSIANSDIGIRLYYWHQAFRSASFATVFGISLTQKCIQNHLTTWQTRTAFILHVPFKR